MKQTRLSSLQRLLLVAVLLLPTALWAQTKPADLVGEGTEETPFEIKNAADLLYFSHYVNGTYTELIGEETTPTQHLAACARLTADIDLSSVCHDEDTDAGLERVTWVPIAGTASQGDAWTGTFEGNGHTIKNLYIYADAPGHGLFAHVGGSGATARISHLVLQDVTINAAAQVGCNFMGALAGTVFNATLLDVKAGDAVTIAPLSNYYVGGLVGDARETTFEQCESKAYISGNAVYAAGICSRSQACKYIRCANYGTIHANGEVGGITAYIGGSATSELRDCANYGAIEAQSYKWGGLVGEICAPVLLENVLSVGDVQSSSTNTPGLLVGYVETGYALNVQGHAIYNSEATGTTVPIGNGSFTTGSGTACSADDLKSGFAAWLLQQDRETAAWGQDLAAATAYPQLGDANRVYASSDVALVCNGSLVSGTFSNTVGEPGTVTITHGSPIYHDAVAATCATLGSVAYYECNTCHKAFSDEGLTTELADITTPVGDVHTSVVYREAQEPTCTKKGWYAYYICMDCGSLFSDAEATNELTSEQVFRPVVAHSYNADDICTVCGHKLIVVSKLPLLSVGDNLVQIPAVTGGEDEPEGYVLYRFIAPADGMMTVKTVGDEDTYGILLDADLQELDHNDDGEEDLNFCISYNVTGGTTYVIGVRELDGDPISGDYTLTISGPWDTETESLTFNDGDVYETSLAYDNVGTLTYNRNFSHTSWQALYVPFAIPYDQISASCEVAALNNLHQYDDDNDGVYDRTELEVLRVKDGETLSASTPYLIKPKATGDWSVVLTNVPVQNSRLVAIDCSSVRYRYTFRGTYSGVSGANMVAGGYYALADGVLCTTTNTEASLGSFRWYMSVEDRMGGSGSGTSLAAGRILIVVKDENGQTTGIETLEGTPASDSRIYDLNGRRLAQPLGRLPQGVYIINGKKMVK